MLRHVTFFRLVSIITTLKMTFSMLRGRPRIILLGDSITQLSFSSPLGFGAYLADVYQRRADVLNRGFSGYNTNWILEHLRSDEGLLDVFGALPISEGEDNPAHNKNDDCASKSEDQVLLVTVFFGANDASCALLNERQHVPVEQYKSNLKEIASIIKKTCPHAKIIFIAPPPIHHDARLKYQIDRYGKDNATGKLERTMEMSGKYATAACEVSRELSVPCLNLWSDMQASAPGEKWHDFLSDGLHLSPSGNKFVAQGIEKLILENFPDLAVSPCAITGFFGNSGSSCTGIKQAGPWHDEITDSKNFIHSFKKRKVCLKSGESD